MAKDSQKSLNLK